MPAPKRPNPHPGGEVMRQRALRREVDALRAEGYLVVAPDDREPGTAVWLVDVAAQARKLYGEKLSAELFPDLPEVDHRFTAVGATGARICFERHATAERVAAHLLADIEVARRRAAAAHVTMEA